MPLPSHPKHIRAAARVSRLALGPTAEHIRKAASLPRSWIGDKDEETSVRIFDEFQQLLRGEEPLLSVRGRHNSADESEVECHGQGLTCFLVR